MRHHFAWLIGTALVGAAGCGDGGSGPSPGDGDAARAADRFEELADSVGGEGYSPTAQALRHAAEIVRLTGRATPVTLTIDGAVRSFLAVAEQLDYPQIQCADSTGVPPTDTPLVDPEAGECTVVGTHSMRTLIAWEPERMTEVVRQVADIGSNEVNPRVPDVMTGLPASPAADRTSDSLPEPAPGDSAVGGGGGGGPGLPGFLGEYLVGDEGLWFAVEGSQANELAGSGGACTSDDATFHWVEFRCEAARFAYEFSMRLEPLFVGPVLPEGETPLEGGDGTEGEHTIAMARTEVDGVRLTVVRWSAPPPPEPGPPGPDPVPPPGPDPVPPDSVVASR